MTVSNEIDLFGQRAARREASGGDITVRLSADSVVVLPAELPIDTFAPFLEINLDLAVFLRKVFDAYQAGDKGADLASALVDVLIVNPDLPREVLGAVQSGAEALFGVDGYAALVTFRPSPQDIGVLVGALLQKYGVTLGEALGPRESSESAGPTSSPTSDGSTDSTLDPSTVTPDVPGSSEPAT